ncbi:MAG TPA: response regulator [Pyrinomonadaceae bacterium]|nr:response regulator [Pyrinomonadaceae bacterium]
MSQKKGSVLIVEDMAELRQLLCELLGGPYECRAVRAAEEGLEMLAEAEPDVIITDVKLPGMSGPEFLAEVRRRHPGVPVIVVTGGDAVLRERDFMEMGAFGYLLKPYLVGEVESLVWRAVECRRGGAGR